MQLKKRSKNGNWYLYAHVGGEKIRESTGTTDRATAQERGERIVEQAYQRRKLNNQAATPFSVAASRFVKEKEGKRTLAQDEDYIEVFSTYFGDMTLQEISREVIEKVRDFLLDDDLERATVDRYMSTLRAILRMARDDWEIIDKIPKVPMYGKKGRNKKLRWLKFAEFDALIEELPPHLKLAARFAVVSGLRMRSMLRMTWDRVDLEKRFAWAPGEHMKGQDDFGFSLSREAVRILRECRVMFPSGENVFQYRQPPTLTTVEMRETARDLIRTEGSVSRLRLKARLRERFGAVGNNQRVVDVCREESALFASRGSVPKARALPSRSGGEGQAYDDANTAAFKKAVERAGVGPLRWHDLRHTFASWAVQGGVTLQELMQMGNWKSYSEVLKYAHLAPPKLSLAAEKVRNWDTNRTHLKIVKAANHV